MRILLVEDHGDTAEAMSRLLMGAGHDVVLATNVSEAATACNAEPFDILVCDMMLPGGDGWGLARMADARRIPAIAVSALAQPKDVERGKRAGFVAYLTKPVPFENLERILYEAVRTYTPQQSDEHAAVRRDAFRNIIRNMTTEELNRLSAVLKSTQDLSEEMSVLQEQIAARVPNREKPGGGGGDGSVKQA